jgi:hypothetical protein
MQRRLDHLMDGWHEAMHMHPEWRGGQAFFNVLHDYDPQTAEALRVSDCNPFYNNGMIHAAIQFVAERWEN